MLKLVAHYRTRTPEEWAPLFYRILENRIQDHHRRRSLTERLFAFFGFEEDDEVSPLETFPASPNEAPEAQLDAAQESAALRNALKKLPLRQQQVVLLRDWEGLDVRATAQAMGCSEGSVKTHHSRALAALRSALGEGLR
jgi:RNA polymerase sigma-70 factor, ECF subfamily